MEQQFLNCFSPPQVRRLLEKACPAYEELYLGNICEPVLLMALGCFLTDAPIGGLFLVKDSCKAFAERFRDKDRKETGQICSAAIQLMLSGRLGADTAGYFAWAGRELGSRIFLGLETGTLDKMFFL